MTKFSYRFLPFSQRLFLSVIVLFIAFAACFLLFQYNREKAYKSELLNTQLQNYNDRLYDSFLAGKNISIDSLRQYVSAHMMPRLRVTLISPQGKVIYDSTQPDASAFGDHSSRKEVRDALLYGTGYAISRHSESVHGEKFFYSARYYPGKQVVVRSALPYSLDLIENLAADSQYLWFTAVISLLLIIAFYRLTRKLGMSVTKLQQFALKADRNEPIETGIIDTFPKNELGEISQHIIQIYKRLHKAKEALYIEREKLIAHLRTSHEGLGVFTCEDKEILVNDLFMQYANLMSDHNLTSAEGLFDIDEMRPIMNFLRENKDLCGENINLRGKDERRIAIRVNKDGRSFSVECIVFQDLSFEVSICDVTQEEEQARLKRQLTQNIAHELKTPVSSIQGYLETVLANPNIPIETRQTFLERCYAQSNRLTTLLRDISTLSRMDEAPNLMDREEVDLGQLVRAMQTDVALALEEKNITMENQLPPHLKLTGNSSLLYSIFRNLTDNAIAYAGVGVTIAIACFREDENYYYFSFSDTGVGVPSEHLNRLFERFYRIDKGRSRKLGGTGLGLAIVKNAVLFHGGTIFAKNRPNGGLEFVFTLRKK